MIRAYKIALIIGLMVCGVWGCTKSPTPENPQTLARIAKLEQDLKIALTAQESIRARLTSTEENLRREVERTVALSRERDAIGRERDALNVKLREKASERDQVQAQYDSFRKNIRELLGNADIAALPAPDKDVPTTRVSMPKPHVQPGSGS